MNPAQKALWYIESHLAEPMTLDGHRLACTGSLGVTLFRDGADGPDALLCQAELAMYKSKQSGRNTVRLFQDEMQSELDDRNWLEKALRDAIRDHQLTLHYQIQVDAEDRPIGAEALLRWYNSELGNVSPAEFIPVAEETGLIVPIGEWTMRQAALEATHWQGDVSVAVNLSSRQFADDDLADMVERILAETRLAPSRLELEITESVLMENLGEVLPILHALKERGIRISMDDFGTGYSSLSYLSSFPFDKIKIDKSFVNDIVDNKEAHAIMRAIILLGDALGMRVTVEGVETAAQLALLECEECDEIQGYHISPPRPARDVPYLLSMPPTSDDATDFLRAAQSSS